MSIAADTGNSGAVIDLRGAITASSVTVTTGNGNDTVDIAGVTSATSVKLGTGLDVVAVGSNVMPLSGGNGLTNTQGVLAGVKAALSVTAATGANVNDELLLDDTADGANVSGTLTGSTLTGLGMTGGSISYARVALLDLAMGSGTDTLSIRDTGVGTTTSVALGAGTNAVTIGSASHLLSGIQGIVQIAGGGGTDTLTIDDSLDSSGAPGQLLAGILSGLGIGNASMLSSGIGWTGVTQTDVLLGTGANNFTVGALSGATEIDASHGSGIVQVGPRW